MKHKNSTSALLYRVFFLLCGGVALLLIMVVCCSLRGYTRAASSMNLDVVVNNAAVAEISFTESSPDYSFSLGMDERGKLTRHVTVTTNSPNGFTLFMSGDNTLTNSTYSTADSNIFNSVSSNTAYDSLTGNTWGYALGESESVSTFGAIPTEDTQIGTSSSRTGTYPVTVAVSVHDAVAASYSGSLTFTATVEAAPVYYAIYYNDNYSGTFSVSNYSGTDASHQFTITSSTPTRSGYTFLGWSMDSSATAASYTSGNTLTLYNAPSNGQYGPVVTLYAVWQEAAAPAPSMMSSPAPTSTNSGEDANSGNAAPKGVTEKTDTIENVSSNSNLVPAIAALTTATLATGGFIYFIVAKRDDDEEDDEGVEE